MLRTLAVVLLLEYLISHTFFREVYATMAGEIPQLTRFGLGNDFALATVVDTRLSGHGVTCAFFRYGQQVTSASIEDDGFPVIRLVDRREACNFIGLESPPVPSSYTTYLFLFYFSTSASFLRRRRVSSEASKAHNVEGTNKESIAKGKYKNIPMDLSPSILPILDFGKLSWLRHISR